MDSFIVPANNSEFSVIKTIGLGDVKVNDLKVGLIEFEDTFKFDLNGMIGSDFMRFYQVNFDYQQEQLSFSQNKYMGSLLSS